MTKSSVVDDNIASLYNKSTQKLDQCVICSSNINNPSINNIKNIINNNKVYNNKDIITNNIFIKNNELLNICKCDNKKVHLNCLPEYNSKYGTHCNCCDSNTSKIGRSFSYVKLRQFLLGCSILFSNILSIFGFDYSYIIEYCLSLPRNDHTKDIDIYLRLALVFFTLVICITQIQYDIFCKYGNGSDRFYGIYMISMGNFYMQFFGVPIMYMLTHRITCNVLNWLLSGIIIILCYILVIIKNIGYNYFFPETLFSVNV
jgi:hypothetical protein